MFQLDKTRVEASLRVGLAALLGSILAVADIPSLVPPSNAYSVGIASLSLSIILPRVAYSILSSTPLFLGAICMAALSSSAVLAAGVVSDGLFVAVFSLFALIYSGYFFGNLFSLTGAFANAIVLVTGSTALGLRVLVQDGFSFGITPSSQRIRDAFSPAFDECLPVICEHLNVTSNNCSVDVITSLVVNDTFAFVIPKGIFAGQEATISIVNDSTLHVDIPGGLWLIRGFWTWSGTQLGLAVYRNLLIVMCWVAAVLIVSILVPPIRTARAAIGRDLVPQMLRVTSDPNTEPKTVISMLNMLQPSIAKKTIFEPRICRAPCENLVPLLASLVDHANRSCLTLLYWAQSTNPDDEKEMLESSVAVMRECANALEKLDPSILDHETVLAHASLLKEKNRRTMLLVDVTRNWLLALQNPKVCIGGKKAIKNLLGTYAPVVVIPFLLLFRFFQVLALPLQPKYWDIKNFLWAVKRAAGFVLLIAMDVYWDAYANFFIQTAGPQTERPTGSFSSWQLIAYAFVWLISLEGTVKKGLMRLGGTLLGGFTGWLALVVCSGFAPDGAPINPYGLVAWLTITTAFFGYITAFEPGMHSYLGVGHDHGYLGLYFLLTQSVVTLEAYHGKGTRNQLALNRIVANVVGILTAIVVALIPPYIRGADPSFARDYFESIRDAYLALLRDLVKEANREDGEGVIEFDDAYKKRLGKDMAAKRGLGKCGEWSSGDPWLSD